jgi:NTE family protein
MFDDAQFPKHGVRSSLQWNSSRPSLGADTAFDTLEFDFAAALSRGKNAFVFGVDYATTLDSLSPVQNYFPLGGFLRLSGLQRGQISGPHAALLRVVYYRQVSSSGGGLLHVPVYVGVSLEGGNTWQNRDDMSFDSMLMNGSVFLGLDTLIGPVYLAAGFAEGGRSNFYLFVGATPR